jgi:hypothetical protein
MKAILLKLPDDTHERWSQRARSAGMNLSAWVRAKCDEEIEDTGEGHPPITRQALAERMPVSAPISRLTGHPPDCDCMVCVQHRRFATSPTFTHSEPSRRKR